MTPQGFPLWLVEATGGTVQVVIGWIKAGVKFWPVIVADAMGDNGASVIDRVGWRIFISRHEAFAYAESCARREA